MTNYKVEAVLFALGGAMYLTGCYLEYHVTKSIKKDIEKMKSENESRDAAAKNNKTTDDLVEEYAVKLRDKFNKES